MTQEAIARVQDHFSQLARFGEQLAAGFYERLFAAHPELRSAFPADLAWQIKHFSETLALVIDNLGRVIAVDEDLRALGVRHLSYGALPQHYVAVREALLQALADIAPDRWNDLLARDWKLAIGIIMVPMLRGAAMEYASAAQSFAAEDLIAPREESG